MAFKTVFLSILAVAALAGCGGGGGGIPTVSNAQFKVAWPARSRDAMQVPLTSALSARVVLNQAGVQSSNITINIDRDAARLDAYTGTYTVAQSIVKSKLGSLNATFYSQPSQGGSVVGTATSTATFTGTNIEFAPISLTGTITNIVVPSTTLTLGDNPLQLTFSAENGLDGVVAVSPGSAIWSVIDGSELITLSADGIVAPVAAGTAHIRASVDGVNSPAITVEVVAPAAPIFTWASGKGGTLIQPSFDAVEGNQFQIVGGKNVVVTSLGYEFKSATQVPGITAIFDINGNVLAQATISNTDPLINGFYYKAITPLTLTSGTKYYIGALHGTGAAGAYYYGTNAASTPAFINELGGSFKVTSTIQGGHWDLPLGPKGHYVNNFQAYQVP